jgi:hypothetical protein
MHNLLIEEWDGMWMLGRCVKVSLLTSFRRPQPTRSALHNVFLNLRCVIGCVTKFGPCLYRSKYMMYMLTSVTSRSAQKTRCHHLWLRVCEEYEACNWFATSTPLMNVVYSRSTCEVGIFSFTAPFLRGTSTIGTHRNPIGIA